MNEIVAPRPSRRYLRTAGELLTALLVSMALSGCGGGRPIKYYQVSYPPAAPAKSDAIEAILMVRTFDSSQLYLDDRIVYGFDSPEMGTYEYQRWVEPPVAILQDSLVRGLRASGLFRGVFGLRSDVNGGFILAGHLYDFKEVDGSAIVARLSYEARMRDRKSGLTVWSFTYSHDEPAAEKSVTAVVQAMDKNVQRSVQELQASLEQYFRAHPVK